MKLAQNLERLGTESAFKILAEAKKLEAKGKKTSSSRKENNSLRSRTARF